MKRIELAPLAELDLLDIWEYIARDNPRQADRLIEGLTAQFARLAEFPKLGRIRREFGAKIRSLSTGDYVVFYLDDREKIAIARVLHGARDIEALMADS